MYLNSQDLRVSPIMTHEEIAMSAKTLYDKLWDDHLVKQRDDGSCLLYIENERDEMFEEQQTIGWDVDMKTYYKVKEKGFDKYIKKFGTL